MDHPLRLDHADLAVRPWRTATLVVAGIAALELVLLVMRGGALLAKPEHASARKATERDTAPPLKPRADGTRIRHLSGPVANYSQNQEHCI